MKRIALDRIGESAVLAVRRFPAVMACAALAALTALILIDGGKESAWVLNTFLAAQLGIPLLLAITLATEKSIRPDLSPSVRWIAQGGAILVLFIYHLALPDPLGEASLMRHFQLTVAAHLAVTLAPFQRRGENNAFWQFNVKLALRLLAALFFSHVLSAGLGVALFAIDQLLGVNVGDAAYPRMWVTVLFIFNTWFFLAGIPERPQSLESDESYPGIVKVFGQFILTPLVMVYLAILSLYLVKVVLSAEWPSGQIGYLVSSVAVAGLFSLLLLYPLSVKPGIRWVGLYARLYYVLLVPAVIMLLMAIGKRIGQYGVTEPRYLLLVMAIWLAGIVLVGVVRGRPFLKIIPLSLAVVAIITAYGPLSTGQVSRRSQLGRLDTMLSATDRLVAGRIVTAAADAPREEGREIGSILNYLFENHGPGVLGERVDSELQAALDGVVDSTKVDRIPVVELTNTVTRYANLPIVHGRSTTVVEYHRVERAYKPRVVELAGYDHAIQLWLPRDENKVATIGSHTIVVDLDSDTARLEVLCDDWSRVVLDLDPWLNELADVETVDYQRAAPDRLMSLTGEGIEVQVKFLANSVGWAEEIDGFNRVNNLQGMLLVNLDGLSVR